MAISFVGKNSASKVGAASGNTTVSLTALTGGSGTAAQAGDLVIAVFATGSVADKTLLIQDPGAVAYTLIGSELYSHGIGYDSNLRVAYKRLTGADASVTFGPTTNATDGGSMCVSVYRGVDPSSPMDVAAVTATGINGGRPTPPAITPSTTGAWIVCTGGAVAATGAVFTAPDLSGFVSSRGTDSYDGFGGVGYFSGWISGQYVPAQWTGGTTNVDDAWAAITLALRPEASTGHSITTSNTQQGNQASQGTVQQTHKVATGNSQTGNQASQAAISSEATTLVTVADCTQANTLAQAAINQTHLVSGASSSQANASALLAVKQTHTVSVASSQQINTATDDAVKQTCLLGVSAAQQVNQGSQAAVKASHLVTAATVQTVNQAAQAAIVQTHKVTAPNASQANAGTTGGVSQASTTFIAASSSSQSNQGLSAAIKQTHKVSVSFAHSGNQAAQASVQQTHKIFVASSQQSSQVTAAAVKATHLVAAATAQTANQAAQASVQQTNRVTTSSAQQTNTGTQGSVSQSATTFIAASHSAQAIQGNTAAIQQTHRLLTAPVAIDNIAAQSVIVQTHLILAEVVRQANTGSTVALLGKQPFTQEQLDYLLVYVQEHIVVPTVEEIASAVWQHILEGGISAEALQRILLAALVGKTAGIGSNSETYLAQDGLKSRIVAGFDASNNRTSVVLDGGV